MEPSTFSLHKTSLVSGIQSQGCANRFGAFPSNGSHSKLTTFGNLLSTNIATANPVAQHFTLHSRKVSLVLPHSSREREALAALGAAVLELDGVDADADDLIETRDRFALPGDDDFIAVGEKRLLVSGARRGGDAVKLQRDGRRRRRRSGLRSGCFTGLRRRRRRRGRRSREEEEAYSIEKYCGCCLSKRSGGFAREGLRGAWDRARQAPPG